MPRLSVGFLLAILLGAASVAADTPEVGALPRRFGFVGRSCAHLLERLSGPSSLGENQSDADLRELTRQFQRVLEMRVHRFAYLEPGEIRVSLAFGKMIAVLYNPDPIDPGGFRQHLQDFLENVQAIQRLAESGVRFTIRQLSSTDVRIWIRSLDSKSDDPFVRRWARRMRRHGLSYHFYDFLFRDSVTLGSATDTLIYVRPTLFRSPEVFEKVVIHESVHGLHARTKDATKNIRFTDPEYDFKTGRGGAMPGAPKGYEGYMASGELEAQCVGETLGGLANRKEAWAKCRPFLIQLEWLRTLRAEIKPMDLVDSEILVEFRGRPIEIEFRGAPRGADAETVSAFVRSTLDQRIRHLENLSNVRSRAE